MNGMYGFTERITPDEAIRLFKYAKLQEMLFAKRLYIQYRETNGTDRDAVFDLMSLLAFAFDTGRVQGIREERAKRTG